MSDSSKDQVTAALGTYHDPVLDGSPLDSASVEVTEGPNGLAIDLCLGFPARVYGDALQAGLEAHLAQALNQGFTLSVRSQIRSHAVQSNLKPLGEVRNIIAVASAKGGVGKSTTAVNLALALSAEGAQVGLLDADIYGPSQPRMLGLRGQHPQSADGKTVEPMQAHGIVSMSIGFLVDEDQPMVWRGPMVTQALTQIIGDTNWGELDYLIVDMPPGTGDTQLTMSQRVPLSGAVIVTTPQDIALLDARKGLHMFEKVQVNVLGVVENMSTHICSSCGHEEHIFGAGGGARMAEETGAPFLGSLPLDLRIRENVDNGLPTVAAEPTGELARTYREIAIRMAAQLARGGRNFSNLFPNIVVENT